MHYGGGVTIAIALALAAVFALGVLAFNYFRQAQPADGDKGRVSQSWLMERRADERDRFM